MHATSSPSLRYSSALSIVIVMKFIGLPSSQQTRAVGEDVDSSAMKSLLSRAPGHIAPSFCQHGSPIFFHWPGIEISTSFSWPRRWFWMQQDTFFMELSVMITEAATVNRPSSSWFLDSAVNGSLPPEGVLHCASGSGNQPEEVHSSWICPFSLTSMLMWGSEPRAMVREVGLNLSVDIFLGAW